MGSTAGCVVPVLYLRRALGFSNFLKDSALLRGVLPLRLFIKGVANDERVEAADRKMPAVLKSCWEIVGPVAGFKARLLDAPAREVEALFALCIPCRQLDDAALVSKNEAVP